MYQFYFGFPLNFTRWSNFYYNTTNMKMLWIFRLLFSLYQLIKLRERQSKVLDPDFKKSHAFPS
jgi:hypothetical protein